MSGPDRDAADEAFMAAALAIGRRRLGETAENPAVGALIVRDGVVIAQGWTERGGRPHAETLALGQAGDAARGATLYVTLEPCSHHGRTPPCAEAVRAAGIARVVSAMEDPDPRVGGRGHALLRQAGIEVVTGVREGEARRAHRGHVLRATEKRPAVTLKLAETSDGYAAGESGARLAITAAAANGLTHMLRAQHDATMVGIGTARADDPLLTVRLPGLEHRKPVRVVLDPDFGLDLESRLVATARDAPVLAIGTLDADAASEAALRERGVDTLRVARARDGGLDLGAVLRALAARGHSRLFSEGGPRVAASLIAHGLADEIVLFTAPTPLGFVGLPALSDKARGVLADPNAYMCVADEAIGPDRMRRYERVG